MGMAAGSNRSTSGKTDLDSLDVGTTYVTYETLLSFGLNDTGLNSHLVKISMSDLRMLCGFLSVWTLPARRRCGGKAGAGGRGRLPFSEAPW